jgi:hypothetical protein
LVVDNDGDVAIFVIKIECTDVFRQKDGVLDLESKNRRLLEEFFFYNFRKEILPSLESGKCFGKLKHNNTVVIVMLRVTCSDCYAKLRFY